ncbi:autotransporter assembly complex protein TamA [Qipengyuania spongiae]|uniref:BamA/TamA family outer membrane protein n=1 Tax=Qipengyuania spongiae TaxID=2909673 RepID=A0ABY5T1R2_9SPHN|nr:BamA/TamA family outer membrane protein [Qipengyuania spongiae]UVI40454.1 BamA/TamA family outer membrane protein [Qipengyuania spongiae]
MQLEDLIPDSAVENPDAWADEGAETGVEDAAPAVDPDTPIDPLPGETIAWPDEIELPPLEPLAPEEDIEFADLEIAGPQVAFSEADTRQITDELVLGFPQQEPPFSADGDFVERFAALSTIRELDTDEDNLAQLGARAREDEELLVELLRVYGYYDGQVVRSIGGTEPGTEGGAGGVAARPVVRFDVIPGERYTFGTIDLGNLASAPDAEVLRDSFEIRPGDPLDSDRIVAEQADLDRMLGETGYVFAALDAPELLIDHDRIEGDLTLSVEPNGKYVFGEITSNDPEFLSGPHFATIARFEPGDIYQRTLEFDLRRAITATGLVSSVTVTPREVVPPVGGEPGTVAMDVEIERAELRTIAGAIGYGSEEGIRVQASWEHRNLFPPEGSLRLRGIVGTQEQLAGITFRKNNFGGRDRVLTVDGFATTIDSPAFDARTVSLVATYEQLSTLLFQKPVSWSGGIELVATDERPPVVDGIAQPRETFFVAALPGFAQVDTSDDLLDPTRGFRLSARLSPEVSRSNRTQDFYLRARIDGSHYQQVSDRVVLAGRVAVGSIPGAPLGAIAPSRRYYAGGGGSVRGYGFREIGPVNIVGEPSGGRSLVEVAAEARIRTGLFDGAVSVVPFIDAGSVSPSVTPDFDEIKVGAGIGVRYTTGFGPIRVDVGVPINPDPDDSPVAVYVSLGQAF